MGSHKKTVDKKAALKLKLQSTTKRTVSKTTTKDDQKARRKRTKQLEKAFGTTPSGKTPLYASTKHSVGRRELRTTLDRAILEESAVMESVRGIGRTPGLTNAQLMEKAREEREAVAVAYEKQKRILDSTVDELAQLMNDA
ncbi:hypothetical protein FBU59_000156 [Linderina macrospora]|uniref:Uncharacterized protein n=1 Tax=Linderina macrospora TaxID=4868 RepID=A0ACC1JI01_9FUNG|nr:hypothetical protein FBU59_000156 [Linderina macrospora]